MAESAGESLVCLFRLKVSRMFKHHAPLDFSNGRIMSRFANLPSNLFDPYGGTIRKFFLAIFPRFPSGGMQFRNLLSESQFNRPLHRIHRSNAFHVGWLYYSSLTLIVGPR
jgi:hypothetical protein